MRTVTATGFSVFAVLCTLSCASYTVQTIGGRRYVFPPGNPYNHYASTYVVSFPTITCRPKSLPPIDLCQGVSNPAACWSVHPLGGAPQCGPAEQRRRIEVSVEEHGVTVHIDGGACPIPRPNLDPIISAAVAAVAECDGAAPSDVAREVQRRLPRSFDEALIDEAGLHGGGPVEPSGRFVELQPGMRLRFEGSTFLAPLLAAGTFASTNQSYLTISRSTVDDNLSFDPFLDAMSFTAPPPINTPRVATSPIDLADRTLRNRYWNLVYGNRLQYSTLPGEDASESSMVLLGSSDYSALAAVSNDPNRNQCLRHLCGSVQPQRSLICVAETSASVETSGAGVEVSVPPERESCFAIVPPSARANIPAPAADVCQTIIANVGMVQCVRLFGRSVIVPEIRIEVNGALRYVPVGTRLEQLVTIELGSPTRTHTLDTLTLTRWWNGAYIPVDFQFAGSGLSVVARWRDIPLFPGDRVQW